MSVLLRSFLLRPNGWTGGQYSVYRALLGAHFFVTSIFQLRALQDISPYFATSVALTGAFLSVLFILGYLDHLAALLLAALWALRFGVIPAGPTEAEPLLVYVLLAHLELPRSPLGSLHYSPPFDDSSWRMPAPVHGLILLIATLYYTFLGLAGTVHLHYSGLFAIFLISPLGLMAKYRKPVWTVQLLALVVVLSQYGIAVMPLLALHLFLFDPAWIERPHPSQPDTVFYDGECGLCHRSVIFLLAEDEAGELFRFAPLGSAAYLREIDAETRRSLPDSIVLRRPSGEILVKSRAVLHAATRLGGLWRVGSQVLGVVPRAVADTVYDAIARVRRRLFPKPQGACPMIPGSWLDRFAATEVEGNEELRS